MNNTSLALVVVVGDLPCSRTWHTSGRPLADLWQTSIGGVLPHAPTHPSADLRQTSIGGVLPHAPTPFGRPPADLRQTSSRPPADTFTSNIPPPPPPPGALLAADFERDLDLYRLSDLPRPLHRLRVLQLYQQPLLLLIRRRFLRLFR